MVLMKTIMARDYNFALLSCDPAGGNLAELK
jgi:hypothetical protein